MRNYASSAASGGKSRRTLIFSMRNIFRRDLFRCPLYEFEDTIAGIDDAEIVAPHADPTSRRSLRANKLAFHFPLILKPAMEKVEIRKSYDLFFAICGHPRDLLMLHAARPLRDACTMKICMIDELWIKQIQPHRHFLEALQGFDLVVLYYSQTVPVLSERLGIRCAFVPPGIDSLLFCPFPGNPPRSVDVLSVGRRSDTTHQALLRMVSERDIFYLHDSIAGLEAIHPAEHRRLFANIARRSKYFIVNPGLIDQPHRRGDQLEIGNRYFEGAAAGTIMIGERPANGEFERLFHWPGALVHLPYGSDRIADVIDDLEGRPEKLEEIRRTNVLESLLHHDWAYRWESILKLVGRESMPALEQRKQQLASRAAQLQGAEIPV